MGRPKSVFNQPVVNNTTQPAKVETQPAKRREETTGVGDRFSQNIQNEVVTNAKPSDRRNKPESVFTQNEITQNQTSISDVIEDLESLNNSFIENLFKNDDNKKTDMSFEIIPTNFRVINGRIKGTIDVKSNEKTHSIFRLHTFFSPLDLKQNIFGQKINDLHFKTDFSETIQINESAKNYKNISMKIHVMTENGKVVGQEKFIEVLESDSQDSPEKEKDSNTTKYIIIGVGLLGLALIAKRIRSK